MKSGRGEIIRSSTEYNVRGLLGRLFHPAWTGTSYSHQYDGGIRVSPFVVVLAKVDEASVFDYVHGWYDTHVSCYLCIDERSKYVEYPKP